MAVLTLGKALLALLTDPVGSAVPVPFLTAMNVSSSQDRAFVRFAGDDYPTSFRGEGRERTIALSCLYPRDQQDVCRDLLTLLEVTAPASPDSRLLLRTHAAVAPGMNTTAAVEVDGDVAQTWAISTITVAFTVRVVQHRLVVG